MGLKYLRRTIDQLSSDLATSLNISSMKALVRPYGEMGPRGCVSSIGSFCRGQWTSSERADGDAEGKEACGRCENWNRPRLAACLRLNQVGSFYGEGQKMSSQGQTDGERKEGEGDLWVAVDSARAGKDHALAACLRHGLDQVGRADEVVVVV